MHPMGRGDSRALSRRSFEVVAAVWVLAGGLLLGVVALTHLLGAGAVHHRAALVEILFLDTLASSPSGTPSRIPGGAHPAVTPAHVPGGPRWRGRGPRGPRS